MSAALLDAVVHSSGHGSDVSRPARVELGASGDTLRGPRELSPSN